MSSWTCLQYHPTSLSNSKLPDALDGWLTVTRFPAAESWVAPPLEAGSPWRGNCWELISVIYGLWWCQEYKLHDETYTNKTELRLKASLIIVFSNYKRARTPYPFNPSAELPNIYQLSRFRSGLSCYHGVTDVTKTRITLHYVTLIFLLKLDNTEPSHCLMVYRKINNMTKLSDNCIVAHQISE